MTRYNAAKHGVFSGAGVIDAVDGEGPHDIHADLVTRMCRELAPVGIIEEELVSQLVDIF